MSVSQVVVQLYQEYNEKVQEGTRRARDEQRAVSVANTVLNAYMTGMQHACQLLGENDGVLTSSKLAGEVHEAYKKLFDQL